VQEFISTTRLASSMSALGILGLHKARRVRVLTD